MAAGLERFAAVRAADRHGHAYVPHVEMAQAVYYHDITDAPAPACFRLDFGHFLLGHAGVRLVIESGGDPSVREVAHGTQEGDDGPAPGLADHFGQRVIINGLGGQLYHEDPPLTGGSTAISAPGGKICMSSTNSAS